MMDIMKDTTIMMMNMSIMKAMKENAKTPSRKDAKIL